MIRVSFLFYLLLSIPSLLHSSLVWESPHLSPPVELGQKEVVGVFKFKNTGDSPVAITGIRSDCTCTVAELEQKVYAPGEGGELKAVFTVDGREGNQVKKIFVHTGDPSQPTTTLALEAKIPHFATVQPQLLMWREGSEPAEREIRIKTDPANRIKILGQPVGIQYSLAAVNDASGEYILRVKPVATTAKGRRAGRRFHL